MPPIVQPADIPVATDGNLITSDYHNSLRAAILALASQLGAPTTGPVSLFLAPNFIPNSADPNWTVANGVASKPLGGTKANGWLPLALPDRSSLTTLTVSGAKSGTIASFLVQLVRVAFADGSALPLITIQLKGVPDTFSQPGSVAVAGAGPQANDVFKVVDNTNYHYGVAASVLVADGTNTSAQINALRIDYTL